MKMKKTAISIALVVVLLISFALSANAVFRTAQMRRSLVFSGGTAYCSAKISEADSSISATMELWQGSTQLASWSDSDMSSVQLSGSVNVSSGQTYTLVVYGTINGVSFELPPLTRSS